MRNLFEKYIKLKQIFSFYLNNLYYNLFVKLERRSKIFFFGWIWCDFLGNLHLWFLGFVVDFSVCLEFRFVHLKFFSQFLITSSQKIYFKTLIWLTNLLLFNINTFKSWQPNNFKNQTKINRKSQRNVSQKLKRSLINAILVTTDLGI